MTAFLHFIDSLSTWVGQVFAWLILILTVAMSYEVFVRYALNKPTSWSFDISYILYGALFLMSGAYTLAHNAHVRGDFMYRKWRPRVQASLDLVLYFLFFLPGICALIYAGWSYAEKSVGFREVSIFSPAGVPVFPLKALIPLAGGVAADPGRGRNHPLRAVHPPRLLAPAPARRRGDGNRDPARAAVLART